MPNMGSQSFNKIQYHSDQYINKRKNYLYNLNENGIWNVRN